MSVWGDEELLVELLDRQFGYLSNLGGPAQLRRLRRLLEVLDSDPRVVGILDDLRLEAEQQIARYNEVDRTIRDRLRELWATFGADIRHRLRDATNESLHAYVHLGRVEQRLEHVDLASHETLRSAKDTTPEGTRLLIMAMHHWWSWCGGRQANIVEEAFRELGTSLENLLSREAHNTQSLREASADLAWPACERLRANATVTNPAPPLGESFDEWLRFSNDADFAIKLRIADGAPVHDTDGHDIEQTYDELAADAKLLHEELRLRIGLGRSRLGLVRRYAAGCEAFHAERLRAACADDSRNAERTLTLDFARFLFDAGMSPLIDATVAGLRPDILDVGPSAIFYVEAKQYDDPHPRSQITSAFRQVWGTWARNRKVLRQSATEAFVVVFRRGGPWVELPQVVRHGGLKIYSVVADISIDAGSREKGAVIRVDPHEILPAGEADE